MSATGTPTLIPTPIPSSRRLSSRGLQCGLKVGYNPESSSLRSTGRNHPSASAHPEVTSAAIQVEVSAGRLSLRVSSRQVHTSPLGLVPKSASQPGEFHLILDLSSPQGRSVNDGIDPELCSIQYAGIDQALLFIRHFGINCPHGEAGPEERVSQSPCSSQLITHSGASLGRVNFRWNRPPFWTTFRAKNISG